MLLISCNQDADSLEEQTPLAAIKNKAEWFQTGHQKIVSSNKTSIDILFLGYSITQRWECEDLYIWLQNFGDNRPFNIGFSGNKFQHLLWRISNGELDNISPKITFFLTGTNNSQENTAIQIADGINKNIKQIIQKLPETKLLVFKIFPRGLENSVLRQVTNQANENVAKAVNNKKVSYIDINEHFLDINSNIPIDIIHDALYLTGHSYET
jgi:beta-glucosidase